MEFTPNPLEPNGFGGVVPENESPAPFHTHDGVNSPSILPSQAGNSTKYLQTLDGKLRWNTVTSSPKAATLVIGPSSNSDSTSYDYVTDGTNDDVEIQAAVDALPSTGGLILFREGTYTLGSATLTIAKDGVHFQGMGQGSVITCKNSFNKIFFQLGHASNQYTNFQVRDFLIDGNKANNSSMSDKPIWDNRTLTKPITNARFLNCYYKNIKSAVLYAKDTGTDTFERNYVADWDGQGTVTFGVTVCLGGNLKALNNIFVASSTTAGLILGILPGTFFENNHVTLPASYNATLITTCQLVAHNDIAFTSGSAAASALLISSSQNVEDNYINMGATPNVASIAIKAYSNVSSNEIFNCGKGITFSNNSLCTVTGNRVLDARGHAIHLDTIADINAPHIVTNNHIRSPGRETANTYSGIHIDNNVSGIIIGNVIYAPTGTSTLPKYGIDEGGTTTKNIISGNYIFNMQTQAIFVQSVTTDVNHNITP